MNEVLDTEAEPKKEKKKLMLQRMWYTSHVSPPHRESDMGNALPLFEKLK